MSFSLRVFTSVIDPTSPKLFVDTITNKAIAWQRSERLQGGFWQGTFTLTGEEDYLLEWFSNRLGYHLEERSFGEITWEGMIYEMTYSARGATRFRSLDEMANKVIVQSKDAATGVITQPATATLPTSIAHFGTRAESVLLEGFDAATATNLGSLYNYRNGWPHARSLYGGLGETGEPTLQVRVCGYVFTMNWIYTTTSDESSSDVTTWIADIVNSDTTEFITAGRIAGSTDSLTQIVSQDTRCWDQIMLLTSLGDSSGNYYYSRVIPNRLFFHGAEDVTNPYYFIKGGEVFDNVGARLFGRKQWHAKPGVWRDLDYPVRKVDQGSLFSDGRDFFVEEVICGTRSGVAWRAADYDPAEQLASRLEYERWQQEFGYADLTSGGAAGPRPSFTRVKSGRKSIEDLIAQDDAERRVATVRKRDT